MKQVARYKLPIEIEPLDEGGFLAVCPILQGCHAEGETVADAIENVEDVARNLIELMREDGALLPPAEFMLAFFISSR